MAFIFDATQGQTAPSDHRKRVVQALLGQSVAPHSIGEGIAALGDGIAEAQQRKWDAFDSDMAAWKSGVSAQAPFAPAPGLFSLSRIFNRGSGSGGLY